MRQTFISLLVVALFIPVIFTYSGCGTPAIEELTSLESQISNLREELSEKQEIVDRLQGEIDNKSNEIDDKSTEINSLLADITEKSRIIEELEVELAEFQKPEEEEVPPRVFGVDYRHSHQWGIRFDDYVESEGWKVIRIDVEPLTYEYLEQQGVSILCIPTLNLEYTEEEIQEVVKFVENGGGLLLVVGHVSSYSDKITMMFGVRVIPASLKFNEETTVLPYHPLGKDVVTLQLDGNSDLLYIEPPAYHILQNYSKPVIAVGEVGAGRFVIYPEIFNLDATDNSYFLRNVLYWLEQVSF